MVLSLSFQSGIGVTRNQAVPSYPESILFQLSAESDLEIESAELEFGTDALSCGETTARAVPDDFTPANNVEVEWDWNLRRTGTLPPGTTVWWRWILRDAAGNTLETPIQHLIFEDQSLGWRRVESDGLVLLWLDGGEDFAQSMINSGDSALGALEQATGIVLEDRVKAYVYPSSDQMQSATLFAPAWSGGLAFPDHRTALMGVPPWNLDWGQEVLAHELSHVVIGRYTFSCVDSTPTWMDEGLAMYIEGDMRPYHAELLADAVSTGNIQSVRELGGLFSADPELASLSYAQSLSLVSYLIETHGQQMILQLLDEFRGGASEDSALTTVIGVNRDGLESQWREWIGAPPMQATEAAGPEATRTPYPTLLPIVGPVAATETETAPTASEIQAVTLIPATATSPDDAGEQRTPLWIVPVGGFLIALAVAGWLLRRRGRS